MRTATPACTRLSGHSSHRNCSAPFVWPMFTPIVSRQRRRSTTRILPFAGHVLRRLHPRDEAFRRYEAPYYSPRLRRSSASRRAGERIVTTLPLTETSFCSRNFAFTPAATGREERGTYTRPDSSPDTSGDTPPPNKTSSPR